MACTTRCSKRRRLGFGLGLRLRSGTDRARAFRVSHWRCPYRVSVRDRVSLSHRRGAGDVAEGQKQAGERVVPRAATRTVGKVGDTATHDTAGHDERVSGGGGEIELEDKGENNDKRNFLGVGVHLMLIRD